jgi:hypothetical protein
LQTEKKISLPFPVKNRHKDLAERLYSLYSPEYLETDPSKIAYTIQYGTTKEIPRYSFAFELIAIPLNIDMIRKDPFYTKSEFHGLVNSSYAALGTRFDGNYIWLRKNGHEGYATDIVGVLQQCGFVFSSWSRNAKNKVPCAILGNLISERVDYTEKSKAKMDASPFVGTIIKAVEKIATKVPTYKAIGVSFAGDSDKYKVSSRPRATTYTIKDIVEMMLLDRIKTMLGGGKVTTEQTQDSLWYNALPKFKIYDVTYSNDSREWFKTCIRKLCKQHGVAREQIGILAAPWASIFFKGQWHDISFETIKELAKKGTDIIFIEKRDIVMALGKYASLWGVALVNTHGILSDYTEDLAELADISGAHIALLTDYDIPGLLIASALKEDVPRLGVDERMLEHFNMSKEDSNIVVDYKPRVDRLKEDNLRRLVKNDKRFSPEKVDIDFLKREKIEIDAVLAQVGAEKLWGYLQELLKKEFPKRDCLRVIDPAPDLSKHYPPIIQQLKLFYDKRAREITEQESKKIADELKDVEGFIDVEQKEKEILDDRLGKIVLEDQLLKDVAAAFVELDKEKDFKIGEIEIPKPEEEEEDTIEGIDITEEEAAKTHEAPATGIIIPEPEITKADIEMHKTLCDDYKGGIIKDCFWTPLVCAKLRIVDTFGSEYQSEELDKLWKNKYCWMNDHTEYLRLLDEAYKETMRQMRHDAAVKKEEEEEEED